MGLNGKYKIEPHQGCWGKIKFIVYQRKFIIWYDIARFDTELEAEEFIKLRKKFENKKYPVDK